MQRHDKISDAIADYQTRSVCSCAHTRRLGLRVLVLSAVGSDSPQRPHGHRPVTQSFALRERPRCNPDRRPSRNRNRRKRSRSWSAIRAWTFFFQTPRGAWADPGRHGRGPTARSPKAPKRRRLARSFPTHTLRIGRYGVGPVGPCSPATFVRRRGAGHAAAGGGGGGRRLRGPGGGGGGSRCRDRSEGR